MDKCMSERKMDKQSQVLEYKLKTLERGHRRVTTEQHIRKMKILASLQPSKY